MENIRTCEFVSRRHPDKVCDQIADAILDAYLAKDPKSRVAVEALGGHGVITVSGEITSSADIDLDRVVTEVVGDGFTMYKRITKQSPAIARGVDTGGAGDQGIMIGFATAETKEHMPLEYFLARTLCRSIFEKYPYDGKVQVTVRGDVVQTVVASFQKTKTHELESLVRTLISAEEYLINPAGEWELGGFDADSGLTGRKIVIDNYGPQVPIGGGSFSGKDYTKVDRSGAYVARHIAVSYLKKYGAKQALVKLAYAIGKAEPVMAVVTIDGREEPIRGFDLSPRGIKERFDLARPIYQKTAEWGHFGNGFPWDKA